MQPALVLCLALVGALFSSTLVGISYFQIKISDPEKNGYFKLQKDLQESAGLGALAEIQRSKGGRIAGFVLSLSVLVCCLGVAGWYGFLTVVSL